MNPRGLTVVTKRDSSRFILSNFLGLLCLTILFLLSGPAQAQTIVCTLGPGGTGYNPYYDSSPTGYAQQVLDRVTSVLRSDCDPNCGRVDYVKNPTVPNAMLMSNGQGRSKLSYSPDFMNAVLNRFGEDAAFGVIAHEIGHHLDALTPLAWMDGSWGRELRADAWAGCAMARASLSTRTLEAALKAIAAYPSPSHPGWDLRIRALRAGYEHCDGDNPEVFYRSGGTSSESVEPQWRVITEPCTHIAHSRGDVGPCTHGVLHPRGDLHPCNHVCYDGYGRPFPCHQADAYPCSHAAHPNGDIFPCSHLLHPEGHQRRVRVN